MFVIIEIDVVDSLITSLAVGHGEGREFVLSVAFAAHRQIDTSAIDLIPLYGSAGAPAICDIDQIIVDGFSDDLCVFKFDPLVSDQSVCSLIIRNQFLPAGICSGRIYL